MDEKNSAKALKKLKSADVVLYFLNAEGVSLGNEELNILNKISRRNKNIIVVLNKIDGIEQNDISLLKLYIEKTIEDRYKVILISAIIEENVEELNVIILDSLSN